MMRGVGLQARDENEFGASSLFESPLRSLGRPVIAGVPCRGCLPPRIAALSFVGTSSRRHHAFTLDWGSFIRRVALFVVAPEELESEIAIWERRRNANQEKIQWMFNCEKARQKLAHAYSQLLQKSDDLQAAA
ncbi:MAG TPA: hypothetical protein PLZ79_01305 [Burkholderiales bacterium]|nr:hypothetical protein [Burkholderiales bacterium]